MTMGDRGFQHGVWGSRFTAGARRLLWSRPSAGAHDGPQVRHVRINDGYEPRELRVRAGQPVRLIFRREETAACSERVVFPGLGISVELPPFQEVAVDLPASAPGVHHFRCQMGVLRGRVIVHGGESTARRRE